MSDVIFLSHGGGPLPLMDKEGHIEMIKSYQSYSKDKLPKAIIVFSAHYESEDIKVIYNHPKDLYFDYYGFPKETYRYEYNPPIDKDIGLKVMSLIKSSGFNVSESTRGFDHGVFVPLLIMYENASIPVVQVSLKRGLDPKTHIELGKALSTLEDVLFIGSGSSYHNLREFMVDDDNANKRNEAFHDALVEVLTSDIDEKEREKKLINWKQLPYATNIHPREEHLIPLHICYGIKQTKGEIIFDGNIITKRNICIKW